MKKLVFLVGCFLFFGSSVRTLSGVHAAGEGKALEHVNERLYPSAVEKKDTSKNPFISALCGLNIGALDKSFMCQAGQWQHIALPEEKKVEDDPANIPAIDQQQVFSAQDIRDAGEILRAADDPRNASVSGEVLAFSDWFNGLLARFVRNEEAGAGRTYWPDALKDMDSNSAVALRDDVGKGILCPYAVCNQASGQEPMPTLPPGGGTPIPVPTGQPPPPNPQCAYGSDYCSVENLRNYFSTDLAAQQASIICQRESGSNPFAANKSCLNTGASNTLDYSIGLFQFNLLAHCSSDMLKNYSSKGYSGLAFNARDVFQYVGNSPVNPCVVLDQVKLDLCEEAMQEAENNIKFTVLKSSSGQNWQPWSAARACNIVGGQPLPTVPPRPTGEPTPEYASCQSAGDIVYAPGTTYQHLDQRFECVVPKIFVVHWSAAWSSAQATYNVLNTRQRSCQFAIDQNTSLQMLDFYKTAMRKGWCAGGIYNDMSINYELTGVYFDDVTTASGKLDSQHTRYAELLEETDKALSLTCWAINFYGMDKQQVYGHFQIQNGKQDPGPKYLEYFKRRVLSECN